jgi:hypothetical protein
MITTAYVGFHAHPGLGTVLAQSLAFLALLLRERLRRLGTRLARTARALLGMSALPAGAPDASVSEEPDPVSEDPGLRSPSSPRPTRAGLTHIALVGAIIPWIAAIALATSGAALAIVGIPKVERVLEGPPPRRDPDPPQPKQEVPPRDPRSPRTKRPPSTETPPKSETSTPNHIWKGECEADPVDSAPRDYEIQIEELYTGESTVATETGTKAPLPERTGLPPGRKEGGCTQKYQETVTPANGTSVWAWGQNPDTGQVLSIAVDSSELGPALFLAPATEPVHALIERFGAVGGIRRLEAGTGDLYPVVTRIGTFILIRREKGSEADPRPSSTLVPVGAQAWMKLMQRTGRFYWPEVEHVKGQLTYRFYTDAMPSVLAYSFPVREPAESEPELSEVELQKDAKRASLP